MEGVCREVVADLYLRGTEWFHVVGKCRLLLRGTVQGEGEAEEGEKDASMDVRRESPHPQSDHGRTASETPHAPP